MHCGWRRGGAGSPLTGGYCKARQRLPEALLQRLLQLSGQRLQQQVPAAWHWHGRAVKIVDGSAVSMPDTEANQQAYPQPGSQAPGLGFPVARLVVVLSLACGAVLARRSVGIKGKQTSEPMLFHGLYEHLERDDVVLADATTARTGRSLVAGPGDRCRCGCINGGRWTFSGASGWAVRIM